MKQSLFFALLPWIIVAVLLSTAPQMGVLAAGIALVTLLVLKIEALKKRSFFCWGTLFVLTLVLVNGLCVHHQGVLENSDAFLAASFVGVSVLSVMKQGLSMWQQGHRFWAEVKRLPPLDSPFLKGNFAPVTEELTGNELEIEGFIPVELTGMYVRNGPNPQFPPYTYTYPHDGDGMLHAVMLEHGWVQYKNRFVETEDLRFEKRAGKALFGGVALATPPDPRCVVGRRETSPFKNTASEWVVPQGNEWLAFSPGKTAYRLDNDFNTLGTLDVKAAGLSDFGNIAMEHFILLWNKDVASIRLQSKTQAELCHHIATPGTAIQLINAFELGEHIKLHYLSPRGLCEGTIDVTTLLFHEDLLYPGAFGFPTFSGERQGQSYRYVYLLEQSKTSLAGVFNVLSKFNLITHENEHFNIPNHWELDEACFVPKQEKSTEDEGYLMLFVFNRSRKKSGFVILDAKAPNAAPLSIVKLPCRVPHGLHGAWRWN